RRIDHEEADEARRVPADGGANRLRIPRDARDHRGAGHAMDVELGDPPVRKLLRRSRILPAEDLECPLLRGCRIGALHRPAECGEEPRREEMAVSIVERQWGESLKAVAPRSRGGFRDKKRAGPKTRPGFEPNAPAAQCSKVPMYEERLFGALH